MFDVRSFYHSRYKNNSKKQSGQIIATKRRLVTPNGGEK